MVLSQYIVFIVLFVSVIAAKKTIEKENELFDNFTEAVSDTLSLLESTESRSSKLKKIALPLLLALKLKSSVVIPIILKALAILSVKAFISGSLALILSSITFFKDFFGKKRERITTAYITAPGPVQAELIEGWNRNGLVEPLAQDLTLGGQYATQNEYQNVFPSQF